MTALVVGLTELGCCAAAGCEDMATQRSAKAPTMMRSFGPGAVTPFLPVWYLFDIERLFVIPAKAGIQEGKVPAIVPGPPPSRL